MESAATRSTFPRAARSLCALLRRVADWEPPADALAATLALLAETAAASGRGLALALILTGRIDSAASPAIPVLR